MSQSPLSAGHATSLARRHETRSVRLGVGQILFVPQDGPDHHMRLESGCLKLTAAVEPGDVQLLFLNYPGDVITRDALPMLPDAGWTAIRPSVLSVFPPDTAGGVDGDGVADAQANIRSDRGGATPKQFARAMLKSLASGRLSGEQKIASLIVELGVHLGTRGAAGVVIDLPIGREEMASYIGLNPDTFSRQMSALKARQLIGTPSRKRIVVPSLDAVAELTPLGHALRQSIAA